MDFMISNATPKFQDGFLIYCLRGKLALYGDQIPLLLPLVQATEIYFLKHEACILTQFQ